MESTDATNCKCQSWVQTFGQISGTYNHHPLCDGTGHRKEDRLYINDHRDFLISKGWREIVYKDERLYKAPSGVIACRMKKPGFNLNDALKLQAIFDEVESD